jgi:hypothetical protein
VLPEVKIGINEKIYKMEWTEELVIKFALFHAQRMRGAYQTDNEFYAEQSMQIFIELKGDVTN